jgi:hypothetical protein
MGIMVNCPNGHHLNVNAKYAGKSGYCPFCKAKVHVPGPGKGISDDEIAALMGPPLKPSSAKLPSEEYVHQEPQHDRDGSGISLLGSSIVRQKKLCPECAKLVSFAFATCPRCGTPLCIDAGTPPGQEQLGSQP